MSLGPHHDRLVELGATLMLDTPSAKAYQMSGAPRSYVIAAYDRFALADLRAAMATIYDHAGPEGPARIFYWDTPACKGFERDVLEFYKDERFKSEPHPQEVAVVTSRRLIRMVAATTSIGFSVFTGHELGVYEDIGDALRSVAQRAS